MYKSKRTIGVMIGNANSPHTLEVLRGVGDAAEVMGVNVLFFLGAHSSYYFKDYFAKQNHIDFDYQSSCVFEYSKLCDVDAVIAVYGTLSLYLSDMEMRDFMRTIAGKPTVFLESTIETENSRYLICDNYTGYSQLMDHLIKHHGYRKIVHLAGPTGDADADERRRAYLDAMQKAGVAVTPDMIEYGDYSEAVHDKVTLLLDRNPDADAIVCGNDLMAMTAYEVIKKREILYYKAVCEGDTAGMRRYKKHRIGENSEFGIAVTGFDDAVEVANLDPPITTVAQSPYSHGYMAVKTCIGLMDDPENTDSTLALPKLMIRESCGCEKKGRLKFPVINDYYRTHVDEYAAEVAHIYVSGLLPAEINDALSKSVYDIVYGIIEKHIKRYYGQDDYAFTGETLLDDVKEFLNSEAGMYIPRMPFLSICNDFLMALLKSSSDDEDRKAVVIDAEAKINDYVYTKILKDSREELTKERLRTWFMPLISRDMANLLQTPELMVEDAMVKMNVLGVGDTYLFVLRESIKHGRNEKWICPDELMLAASTINGKVTAYPVEASPLVSRKNIITNYIADENGDFNAVVLNLYSGEYLYGILVSKAKPQDVLSVYHASVQISTALKYCETARFQKRAQLELEKIIREVEDKNEILRSLSEYDQLTGCYNRRGFLERGIKLIRDNPGRKACIVFADLDHLKEINDKYGHTEGDYAIENSAKIIRRALPDSAILARLGGDEFVALFLLSEGMEVKSLVTNISDAARMFNEFSVKPFFVECSSGFSEFICEEDTRLEEVMAMADSSLYDSKRKRRQTIVKRAGKSVF